MAEADPKRCGKCWSCKYCEDIGVYTYEDSKSHMRKCLFPGKQYVDDCVRSCPDYIWDGETTEYWKESSSSSYSSSSSSSGGSGGGCFMGILAIAFVIIGILVFVDQLVVDIIPDRENEKTQVITTDSSETRYGYVNDAAGLNLRTNPNTSSEIITVMLLGEEVKIFKIENGWAYVDFKGRNGWCSTDYLDIEN